MRRALILAAVAALALGASTAFAGTQDFAVVGLHAESHPLKGGDPCVWDGTDCSNFVTEWPTFASADLYLIVARGEAGPGIAALSCGVEYGANLGMFGWSFCASGLQFPNSGGLGDWPASLGGNRMTWDATVDCQVATIGGDGVHALAGSFYVYAYGPDMFQLTMNNNLQSGPEFQVGDCNNAISNLPWPEAAGVIGFGGELGYTPCGVVPVQPATWGQIKSQY